VNPTSLLLGAGAIADAWLVALVLVRGRRTWLRAVFAALGVAAILAAAAHAGATEGVLGPGWSTVTLWALVVVHPLVAILVLAVIHGEGLLWRRPAALLVLVPVPILASLAPAGGWTVDVAYRGNVLGAFLVVCLAGALAEAVHARLTSPLLASDAFALCAGLVALIVAGPVYAYELQALGLPDPGGANLATPLALAAFAAAVLHGSPFPAKLPRPGRAWSGEASVERGLTFVFDEERPKYLEIAARREADRGRPVLALVRGDALRGGARERLVVATVEPGRHAGTRALGTASEFLTRAPGGLVVLMGLADLAAIAGWPRAHDLVSRLRRLCRESGSTLLLSTSRLGAAEKADLKATRLPWWTLPDPAAEAEAVLATAFGSGASRLLEAFGRSHGIARAEVSVDHVPALVAFLERAVGELAVGTKDPAAAAGLRSQVAALGRSLAAYAARTPVDLSNGDWPTKASRAADADLLVRASDYWKGKEADELFAAAQDLVAKEPLYERARAVFVEHLGTAGESLLRTEVGRLGKRPEDLGLPDLRRLADRAAVDLSAMADIVDVPAERARFQGQIESIRRRLAAIAGDDE
jgi:hypothetical protein